jgi:hypothetical protein
MREGTQHAMREGTQLAMREGTQLAMREGTQHVEGPARPCSMEEQVRERESPAA